MATVREQLGCMLCGYTRPLHAFGLNPDTGDYDPTARPPKLQAYRYHFGGRARIRAEKLPVNMAFARGMRDALRAALAVVEAEIAEAEG